MIVGGRNLFKFSHAMDDIVSPSFVLCLLFSIAELMLHEIMRIVEQAKLFLVCLCCGREHVSNSNR
jgi:hypothetical protein